MLISSGIDISIRQRDTPSPVYIVNAKAFVRKLYHLKNDDQAPVDSTQVLFRDILRNRAQGRRATPL